MNQIEPQHVHSKMLCHIMIGVFLGPLPINSEEAVLGWVRIFIGMAQYKVRGITCKAHATCSRILECAYTSTQAQIFTSADVYAHSEILCFNSLTAMPAQTSHERPWFLCSLWRHHSQWQQIFVMTNWCTRQIAYKKCLNWSVQIN